MTVIIVIAWASVAWAGDYWLEVQDVPRACRTTARTPSTKILTAQQVIEELERTFREPGHGIWGHFSNGRLSFCSDLEVDRVESGLIAIGRWTSLADEVWWRDLIRTMFRPSTRMLKKLDATLAAGSLHPRARRRLQLARGEVAKSLAKNRDGEPTKP